MEVPSAQTSSDAEIGTVVRLAATVRQRVGEVIEGKAAAVDLAITALLAESHLLIEDVPGVGKTMLAKSLARAVDCTVRRIQFTPDLLPSDITGVSIFNQGTSAFEFPLRRPLPENVRYVGTLLEGPGPDASKERGNHASILGPG